MQNIVGLLLLGVVGCLASGYNDGYGGGHGFSHGNSYAYNGHYGGKTIYLLLTTIDCSANGLLFQCICQCTQLPWKNVWKLCMNSIYFC